MQKDKSYYFIASSRVHEVFAKVEQWSIIDLYRMARVLPSVAENVLQNMHVRLVARVVGQTPVNRWGVSHPIYEFLDSEKRAGAYHGRFHSNCRTSGIKEAQFANDFCERPSGFEVPHETDSLRSDLLVHDACVRFEEEWLLRSRQQFDRTVLRGMYEDTDKAEMVFRCYKTIHSTLLDLWEMEIALAGNATLQLPDYFRSSMAEATGELLLAGPQHLEHVNKALVRWYKSPLVLDLFQIAFPTSE